MFTAQQYRAKAAEYGSLLETAQSPSDIAEYRDLRQSYNLLADNLDWLTANVGKTVLGSGYARNSERSKRQAESVEEEKVLQCLGAAVILNWNTIPTDLQRSLFESASTIQCECRSPSKQVLAQFLHNHKNDTQHQQQNDATSDGVIHAGNSAGRNVS